MWRPQSHTSAILGAAPWSRCWLPLPRARKDRRTSLRWPLKMMKDFGTVQLQAHPDCECRRDTQNQDRRRQG